MRTSVSAMVIASPPGFFGFDSTGRRLPPLSWIPLARERSGSHSSGHSELQGRGPVLRPPHSRSPSRLGWRPIRGCARDARASSQWWSACSYYHMHAHARYGNGAALRRYSSRRISSGFGPSTRKLASQPAARATKAAAILENSEEGIGNLETAETPTVLEILRIKEIAPRLESCRHDQ